MQFRLALLLAPVLSLMLASCNVHDPEYARLLPLAESNPNRDAIVGMWHRASDVAGARQRMSLLISRDGTGVIDSVATEWMTGQQALTDEIGPFNWQYDGAGVWSLRDAAGRVDQCRLAGGKLLRFYDARRKTGGVGYFVYERVPR